LGLTSPPSSVLCSTKTAPYPSRAASFVTRVPIPCVLPSVRGVPTGLVCGAKPPAHARAFGRPVPHSGGCTRRQVALPSSRVTPGDTCPALRPRWSPVGSPKRRRDCCLPVARNRRLSPRHVPRVILVSTIIKISGLHHAACILVPSSFVRPLLGVHVEFTPNRLARLWSDGTCTVLGSHPLGNNNLFHETALNPKASGLPWRDLATFGDMSLWYILASCVVIPYISLHVCVTILMLWGHRRSVAPEASSMSGGTRFHLDTSHHRPGPFVTRCDRAAPRGVRGRRRHGADHPARAGDADPRPLSVVRHPGAAHP